MVLYRMQAIQYNNSTIGKIVLATSGALAVGTCGYAYYDPKFQQTLFEYVPASRTLLNTSEDWMKMVKNRFDTGNEAAKAAVSSYLRPSKNVDTLDVPFVKSEKGAKSPSSSSPLPSGQHQDDNEDESLIADSALGLPGPKEVTQEKAATAIVPAILESNKELDSKINRQLAELQKIVTLSVAKKEALADLLRKKNDLMRASLDKKEDPYANGEIKALSAHVEKVKKENDELSRRVTDSASSLQKLIDEGRTQKSTASNATLNKATIHLNSLMLQVKKQQDTVEDLTLGSEVLVEHRKIVERGRPAFIDQLKLLIPEVEEKSGKALSEAELTALLACALVRVDRLQKKLDEFPQEEKRHFEQELASRVAYLTQINEESFETKAEQLKTWYDSELERQVKELKESYEKRMEEWMARLQQAHQEHLEEAANMQRRELRAMYMQELDDRLNEAKLEFHKEVGAALMNIEAIERVLSGRVNQDKQNRRAKQLWLACERLKTELETRVESGDKNRPSFAELVGAINEAGADDVFVRTMLGAVPNECVEKGVLGEAELTSRFHKINKLCRRTALIGDQGGGLLEHLWSYLQSLFVFVSVSKVSPDDEIHIRPDQNVFELLARAKCFVKNKDFFSAVKVLRLLKGEPADIASGWLKDVAHYLEVKQAVDLLAAYAAAVSMRTIY